MILTGPAIIAAREAGDIIIDPFDPTHIQPNSVDVTLAEDLIEVSHYPHQYLDVRKPVLENQFRLDLEKGFCLMPGKLYLASTVERAGSTRYAPMLEGRSSLARLGLSVHMTAGFGDVGFVGRWTLEITCVYPTRIYAGMKIAQVCFYETIGKRQLYAGKYSGLNGVEGSKSSEDFVK